MPRQKISAKYTGEQGEHYMGVPARDLTEDEFDALSDEHKATLAASEKELARVRRLHDEGENASAQAVEAARTAPRPLLPAPGAACSGCPPPPGVAAGTAALAAPAGATGSYYRMSDAGRRASRTRLPCWPG